MSSLRQAWLSTACVLLGCTGSDASTSATEDTAGATTTTTAAETDTGPATSSVDDTGATDETSAVPTGCRSGEGPAPFAPDGAAAAPGTLLADPSAPLPDDLADVGIYPAAPDLTVVPSGVVPYDPSWPLWSNGSDKHRYLVLPPGTQIDVGDPSAWRFPAGAVLIKTFLYDDGEGCAVPVETRVMRMTEDGTWDFAAYGWDETGDTATRLDLTLPVPRPVQVDGESFDHHVPAEIDCRSCHETGVGDALGLDATQLSQAQLQMLQPWLSAAVTPTPVTASDEETEAILGMFVGNCVHCHNGGDGPAAAFDLRPDVALANTIDQPTESSASAAGIRIVPGDPDSSILFAAYSGETDDPEVSPMPPVGVDRRDAVSVERLRTFIEGLRR